MENLKPSFFQKLFGSGQKAKEKLKEKCAKDKDEELYQQQLQTNKKTYEESLEKYEEKAKEVDLAKRVLKGDSKDYREALEYMETFTDISELGTSVKFSFDKKSVDIEAHISSEDIVPDFIVSQLASGKLSKKKLTKSKFYEFYQDYVCSTAIRIALETFALLPLQEMRVTMFAKMLNPKNGHQEKHLFFQYTS